MILTQIHHNDSFNPNMYKQTYENLALAAETIAGDNVNMNNRVNELQEEKRNNEKLIFEQEARIRKLQEMYLLQNQQQEPDHMSANSNQIVLSASKSSDNGLSVCSPRPKAAGHSTLEKFVEDIATKEVLNSFLSKSRPPEDFPIENSNYQSNYELQRVVKEKERLQFDLIDSERKSKQNYDKYVEEHNARKALQVDYTKSRNKFEAVVVGSLRRISWLLKREEGMKKLQQDKDLYIKKIETKLLDLHQNIEELKRSTRVKSLSAQKRPGTNSKTKIQTPASVKESNETKLRKLLNGNENGHDNRIGEIGTAFKFNIEKLLNELNRHHFLEDFGEDSKDSEIDEQFDIESGNMTQRSIIGQENYSLSSNKDLQNGTAFIPGLPNSISTKFADNIPLSIDDVESFTRHLEALHHQNMDSLSTPPPVSKPVS